MEALTTVSNPGGVLGGAMSTIALPDRRVAIDIAEQARDFVLDKIHARLAEESLCLLFTREPNRIRIGEINWQMHGVKDAEVGT